MAETEHVKAKFRDDVALLEKLKNNGSLDDSGHREAKKAVALGEANAIRDLGLVIDKAHKEEETALRQDLDKKHLDEQVAFKRAQVDAQAALKAQLLGKEEAEEDRRLD